MHSKKFFYFAAFVGTTIGGFIPLLWGAGLFSFSSVLFSGIGGAIAIVVAYKYL